MSNLTLTPGRIVQFGILAVGTAVAAGALTAFRDDAESGQLATRNSTEPTHQVEYTSDHFVTAPQSDAIQPAPLATVAAPSNNKQRQVLLREESLLQLDNEVHPLQVAAHAIIPLGVALLACKVISQRTGNNPGFNVVSFSGLIATVSGTLLAGLNALADFTNTHHATSTADFFLPLSLGATGLVLGLLGKKHHNEISEKYD